MAISDNTDYTLKGSQIKKIVEEVKDRPTIIMTTTDPGEGALTSENTFTAVYSV